MQMKNQQNKLIVFDWDDTLFPTTKIMQMKNQQNKLIVFDWDDTLFPTTMQMKHKVSLSDEDYTQLNELSSDIYTVLSIFITQYEARNIRILTAFEKGWINQSLSIVRNIGRFGDIYNLLFVKHTITMIHPLKRDLPFVSKRQVFEWKYQVFRILLRDSHLTNDCNSIVNTKPQSCGYSFPTTYYKKLENSLILQQLQLQLFDQLIHDTIVYKRRLARQNETLITQQKEAYVGCDSNGFVHYAEDSVLTSTNHIKYSMISVLGHGTYSRVFKCKRMDENCAYAIKVIRNLDTYQSAAKHEIDILKHIKANDIEDASCCIHIVDAGFYFGHPIFVFPLLSNSLRSSITPHNPFSCEQVVHLMWQMCHAIAFIHSLRIINADLKPDNIMFVNEDSEFTDLQIKIIDFGAAVFDHDHPKHHHMIQTTEYRAPEVILGKEWSLEVDLWSLGCILVELVCGELLFPCHAKTNHLHQIIECIGTPPSHLLGAIEDDNLNSNSNKLRCYFVHTEHEESDPYGKLYDLCAQMLCWDPKERITAKKALQQPVFKQCVMY
eukprot:540651_1